MEGVCDHDPRGSQNYKEYFAADTVPDETCDHHIALTICKESGALAGEYCPKDQVEKRVFIVGAEHGSADYAYCASKEQREKTCTIHDENYVPEDPEEGGDPEEGEEPGEGEDPIEEPEETPQEEEPGVEDPGEIPIPQ